MNDGSYYIHYIHLLCSALRPLHNTLLYHILLFPVLKMRTKCIKSDSGHVDSLTSLITGVSAELNSFHTLGRDNVSDRGFVMKLHEGRLPFKDYANYLCVFPTVAHI